MTDLIYDLYDECLQLGMLPSEFWECTHYDIIAYIKAKNIARKDEAKQNAVMQYQISLNIISGFGGKIIPFEKLFPKLSEGTGEQSWQKQKEIVRKFAEKYNAKKKLERLRKGETK